jgi:hypothetical protein
VTRGGEVAVRLVWQAQDWLATDYTAFVHAVGPDGVLVTQMDKPPLGGFLPTSTWVPGQPVADTFALPLPPDAPTGIYTLYTGFYDAATLARLPAQRDGAPLGDAWVLGTLEVR